MANRSGLLLTAALVGLLSAPAWAAASDEPVATAPIPPPLAATPPTVSTPTPKPDKPAFVNPMASKPAPPKAAAAQPLAPPMMAPPKRPVRSAAKHEPDKKTAADRHRPLQQARQEKERQHVVAHASPATPPVHRPPPRPRYYAGDFPPPPPWYDGMPFGYFAGPWRSPMMPW